MRVKFFAYIRDYTGCKEADVPCEDTVYKLLHSLSGRYGQKFRGTVLSGDGEALGRDVIIMVNGRHVQHLAGILTPLKPDDVVLIFPVVAGG